MSAEFWNLAGSELQARMVGICRTVVRYPYRVLANSVALSQWTSLTWHSGCALGYALNRRRASDLQGLEFMRFTCARLARVLTSFWPWRQSMDSPMSWPENLAGIKISPHLTPANWSLTESCSRIGLEVPGSLHPRGS
jgi:hypothetical protein